MPGVRGGANTVRGLVINRCGAERLLAYARSPTRFIAATSSGRRRRAYWSSRTGLRAVVDRLQGTSSARRNDYRGSWSSGMAPAAANDGSSTSRGAATPGDAKRISGNRGAGVFRGARCRHPRATSSARTRPERAPYPTAGHGIETSRDQVGAPWWRSGTIVVSGNAGRGVDVECSASATIHGNLIGTDVSGVLPSGNRSTACRSSKRYGPQRNYREHDRLQRNRRSDRRRDRNDGPSANHSM